MLRSYKEYKTNDVGLIEKIPSHWQCVRNKNIMIEINQRSINGSEELLRVSQYSGVSIRRLNDKKVGMHEAETLEGYKLVSKNDIVMNIMLAWNGSTGASAFDGIVSPAYSVFRVKQNSNPWYIHYLFRIPIMMSYFKTYSTGVIESRLRLYPDKLFMLFSIIPPRDEQDQIVHFLDWKLSRINKLIGLKKKQVALLKNLKQGLIDDTITQGLNLQERDNSHNKYWFGVLPDGWRTVRCKYLFRERNERSEFAEELHLSMSQKYGLVADNMLDERRMMSESYVGGKICYKDDLVLNRLKAHLGVFAVAPQKGVISPDYTVLKPQTDIILPRFAELLLKSQKCRRELRIRVQGVVEGFWRLYTDDFYTIKLPVPSMNIQVSILNYIDKAIMPIDSAIDFANREVELLTEYRSRLISDVVTGKVDVRGIEIPDFEISDEKLDSDYTEDIEGIEELEATIDADT